MALTADNVRVAVTGAAYGAPLGTTLPTTVGGALNAAFEDLGYVSEDGIVQAINSSITNIKAWQNGDIVRKIQTEHDLTYALSLLETSDETLAAYYGNYVDGVVELNGEQGVRQAWVFQIVDGHDQIRIVVPDGQVTERGDVTYANDEAIMYPLTITAYPDADGVKAYLYFLGAGS